MGDINFTNVWPFNEIHDVTSDGQAMVYIPKIYVRNTQLPATAAYAGKWQCSISNKKIDDSWHVHSAFMNNGVEVSGIEIGKYIASKDVDGTPLSVQDGAPWTAIAEADIPTCVNKRNINGDSADRQGWHPYNIYEHHLLARLMLIEYGTGDLSKAITGKEGGTNATYHGITNVWGTDGTRIYLPGIYLRDKASGYKDGVKVRVLYFTSRTGKDVTDIAGDHCVIFCDQDYILSSFMHGSGKDAIADDLFIISGQTYHNSEPAMFTGHQYFPYSYCSFTTESSGPVSLSYWGYPTYGTPDISFRLARYVQ